MPIAPLPQPKPLARLVGALSRAAALALIALGGLTAAHADEAPATATTAEVQLPPPIIGMYVHTHWSYNHPYAARTWTIEDWEGYLDGLHRLGYNMVLFWPVLETIPDPPTPSDVAMLERFAKVIDIAHERYGMQVYITMSPNVVPKSDVASTYTWENRRFFACDDRINPRDVNAVAKIINQRKFLINYLKEVDGIFQIDSDPGGWPGSTNVDFVNMLTMYRTMFDELRPGIMFYYWSHAGWEAYSRYYATGHFEFGTPEEFKDTYQLLMRQAPEPWGIGSGHADETVKELGIENRLLSLRYGAIEGEPTFPFTNFGNDTAWKAATDAQPRGRLGNAQTHCVQLPNTFAFARGAQGLPAEKEDYIAFAEQLIPGQGKAIYAGWDALGGEDKDAMEEAANKLRKIKPEKLKGGSLKGLLFGSPERFIGDLVFQLDMLAAFEGFHEAAYAKQQKPKQLAERFEAFIEKASAWQTRHNYRNNWPWPRMQETLLKIDDEEGTFAKYFKLSETKRGDGDTPFEQVKDGYLRVESYTPDLLAQMRKRLGELQP